MADATVSFDVDAKGAGTSLNQLSLDFRKTEEAAGRAGKEVDEFNDELNETAQATEKAKPKIDGAGKAIEEAGRKADKAEKKVDELTDEIEKNTRETNENRKAVDRLGDELEDNSRDLNQNTNATERNTGARKRNKRASREAAQAADGQGGALVALGKEWRAVTAAVAGATAGFYATSRAFSAILQPAMDFEQGMANVQAVLTATSEEMDILNKSIFEAGKGLNLTPAQISNAQLFLAMAGLNARQVAQALRPALEMSIAGDLTSGEAADFLTNIAGGFGLDATQFGRVADVSSFTSTRANTSVRELAQGLSQVAGSAAAAGLELEDASTVMGIFGDRGIKAGRAGVMLRQMLVNLSKPTGDAKKVLEELGLTIDDINVKEVGLENAIEAIKEAGISQQQIYRLFDARVVEGVLALMNDMERWKELSEDIKENSEGAAKAITEIKLDTLEGSLGKFDAALNKMAITIADSFALLDVANFLVDVGTGAATKVTEFFGLSDVVSDAMGPTSDTSVELGNLLDRRSDLQGRLDDAIRKNETAERRAKNRPADDAFQGRLVQSRQHVATLQAEMDDLVSQIEKARANLTKVREDTAGKPVAEPPVTEEEPPLVLPKVEAVDPEAKRLEALNKFYESIGTTTEDFGMMLEDNFNGIYHGLLDETQDFGDVLDNTFSNILQTVIGNIWDKYISQPIAESITDFLPQLFGGIDSNLGGGMTRRGPRSGGIDGMGGYLTMVHPNERIIDLQNQSSGGMSTNVNIIQNMDFSNSDDSTVARLQEVIPLIAEAASARVKQEFATGGDLYRFTSGGR